MNLNALSPATLHNTTKRYVPVFLVSAASLVMALSLTIPILPALSTAVINPKLLKSQAITTHDRKIWYLAFFSASFSAASALLFSSSVIGLDGTGPTSASISSSLSYWVLGSAGTTTSTSEEFLPDFTDPPPGALSAPLVPQLRSCVLHIA